MAYHAMICIKSFYPSLSTTSMFSITSQTTSSISKSNHSPLSSENHRSLFVKPAKRGKQRAGGGALFALYYFPFNYQPFCHYKYSNTQRCERCTSDSPGLASESEVYPGLFAVRGNNAVGVVPFISRLFITAFHTENVQHLRR